MLLLALSSCTCSLIINNTHGIAQDLVDEEQGASADLKGQLSGM